jgi:TonB-linked SusC/RagA family outer membrane protein
MRKFLMLFALLMFCGVLAFAQERTVSGTVRDESGAPVPFATVTVKGTKNATTADYNGNFNIKVNGDNPLVFSSTGYTTVTVSPAGGTVSAILKKTATELNAVVVTTALGIRREAKSLGYSTATINADELNTSKPINVNTGLIGQVSGAQISITNNGVDPQIRVQLRGERHISSDNEPLYIVDGMEVRSDYVATLNPEDIASISVLKSASAAALYGSEATNGVIIINTKKGSNNDKPVITLSQTTTFERLAYAPQLQNQFGGYGGEGGTYFTGTPYQFTAINPYTGYPNYIPFENQSYGPPFNGAPSFIGWPNQYGKVDSVPYAAQSKNALQQFFKTGITNQTDVSLSNGDSRNSNYLSMQYVNVAGITPKDQANRANVLVGGRRTVGKFSYNYTANYSNKNTNVVGNDITLGWPIYWTILNTPANIPLASLKDWQDPNSFGNLSNYYNAYYINPWWQVDNSRNISHQDNFLGEFVANLKPTDWFNATYSISGQMSNTIYKGYRNAATFSPYAIAATGPSSGIYGTPSSGDIAGAEVDETLLQRRIQQDIRASFEHKFGDINANLILGNTIWDRYASTQTQGVGSDVGTFNGSTLQGGSPQSQSSGLILPDMYNISYYYGIPSVGQNIQDTRLIGYYGDLTLGYNSYLFLEGNFRRDYSSLLAAGHNSYNVYGVNAGFVFTDALPQLKGFLTYGKLRVAYSHTGQITLSPYQTVNTFNVTPGQGGQSGFPYGGLASLTLSSNYNNPANTPEATNEKEIGLEFQMFHNRISGSATYYHDRNYNQLFQVSLSSSTGYTSANVNAAQTTSEGWEFDAKAVVIQSKDVRWEVGSNLAIQTTTVNSLYGTGSNKTLQVGIGNDNEAIVGMAFPQLYVTDLVRDSATGKVIVDPTTGYPSLSNSLIPVGRTTPKYILGLNTSLNYKNFNLSVIADYRGGYVFYNSAEANLDFTGASEHTVTNGRQNFIYPNSEVMGSNGKYIPNTNVYTEDGNIGFWVYSQYRSAGTSYVENAAAWKIRTISLSYDFSSLISKQKVLKGLSLTAMMNNAFMFRPKENNFTDPEFNIDNSNALGYNSYYELPPTRQYTLIAKFTF